jgi:hypothetical protein
MEWMSLDWWKKGHWSSWGNRFQRFLYSLRKLGIQNLLWNSTWEENSELITPQQFDLDHCLLSVFSASWTRLVNNKVTRDERGNWGLDKSHVKTSIAEFERLKKEDSDRFEKIKRALAWKIVIDIWCGAAGPSEYASYMLENFQIWGYIGLDPFNQYEINQQVAWKFAQQNKPYYSLAIDGKQFFDILPPKSRAKFACSMYGIDEYIIDDPLYMKDMYRVIQQKFWTWTVLLGGTNLYLNGISDLSKSLLPIRFSFAEKNWKFVWQAQQYADYLQELSDMLKPYKVLIDKAELTVVELQ